MYFDKDNIRVFAYPHRLKDHGVRSIGESTTELKAVLFDLDDTLFDRSAAQREVVQVLIQDFPNLFAGIDSDRILEAFLESDLVADKRFWSGASMEEVRVGRGEAFLRSLNLNESLAGEVTKKYLQTYPSLDLPVKSARSVLENLAKEFQLGLVSNGYPDVQYRKLETLGIDHLFSSVVVSEEVSIRKPDPRIFWNAIESLDAKPGECTYVGDHYDHDIIGAKKAGMRACWFNPQCLSLSHSSPEFDFQIRFLDEILDLLAC